MMYGDVLQPDTCCGYTNLPAMTSNGQLPLKNRPYKMKDKMRTVGLISCVGIRKWSRNPPSFKTVSASWKEHSKCSFSSPSETNSCDNCQETKGNSSVFQMLCFFPQISWKQTTSSKRYKWRQSDITIVAPFVSPNHCLQYIYLSAFTKPRNQENAEPSIKFATQGVSSAHYASLCSRPNSNHSETSYGIY